MGKGGLHWVEIPSTTFVPAAMLPPLLTLPELSQFVDTLPIDKPLRVEPPTMVTALLLLESTVVPHPDGVSWASLLRLRSVPVVPSRQTQVGLV